MTKKNWRFKKWITKKFHLVMYVSENLEVRRTIRSNRLGFILLSIGFLAIFFISFWLILIYTPLKERIPGYPDTKVKKLMITNKIRIDSLENEIRIRDQYLELIRNTLLSVDSIDSGLFFSLPEMPSDSIGTNPLVSKGNIWVNKSFKGNFTPTNIIRLFPPVMGVVSNKFDASKKHFGVDIVAQKDFTVKSALPGTVILANYTVETGYSIVIQHNQNIVTIYRHNSSILVKPGEKVATGQSIAVMGNTGELTTGQHLHFEVWIDGKPVDPESYLQF